MEPDSPTSVRPNDPARVHAKQRRSLLGMPTRLALLLLGCVAFFVLAITAFADRQLSNAAHERALSGADAVVARVASDFESSTSKSVADDPNHTLANQLDEIRQGDGAIRSIVITSNDDGDATVLAASPAKTADTATKKLGARALGDRGTIHAGSIARPLAATALDEGSVGSSPASVAIEYDATPVAEALKTDRLRLWIGAIIGACVLAAALLMLLRREVFRPLDELRRAMQQIGSGARGVRIGWHRNDELGHVASEFDSMVAQLEATQDELGKYVKHDPLTGLLTQAAFTDRFAAELTRARREGYPITLLAVDVDMLDEVNKTHDRAAGDQVLADIGSVIGGCIRPTDACGRVGGDSFLVALVGAEADKAAVVIERIRGEIAQRVGIGPERTRVTCGYGIAEYPRHAVDQIALAHMAEAACAHAQRNGRDKALAFGPSGGYVDAAELVPEGERTAGAQPVGARELSSTVHALARALDGIDPVLGGSAHSQRVARYAAAIARELGHGDGVLRELRSAAVLHDVGKVAVPPAILKTPVSQLDDRQRGALHYHAWVARTMIGGAGLASVANVVFHMPERWDGRGYPERLREDAIPESSRILHAAELLDDLTTRGVDGQPPMSAFAAAGEIKRLAGSELDPNIAICLARLVREEGLVGNVAAAEEEAAPAKDAEAA